MERETRHKCPGCGKEHLCNMLAIEREGRLYDAHQLFCTETPEIYTVGLDRMKKSTPAQRQRALQIIGY